MSLASLLARPHLPIPLRLLVLTAAATWRGDWPQFELAAATGRDRGCDRASFAETLLQAVLFCGFPRVVTAFERLAAVWPAATPPAGGGLPVAAQAAAGRALFAAIYGRNDAAVRQLLASCHQEFHDFVLEAAYGRILTRPGLPPHDRELLAVGLLAAQEQERQFVAHARGARHFGASLDAIAEVLHSVFAGCDDPATTVAAWLGRIR
jgi:alkylhydroperoxidase/carboxymuconolactone decarboxylase family protein YurZ